MARILIAAIVLAAAVTLYGLFDCLLRDRGLIRVMPKPIWAIIILCVPVVGFVLWYAFGRGTEDKPTAAPRRRGPSAPDDDEDYLRKVDRDVKFGKHAPEARKPEDQATDSEDKAAGADGAPADPETRSSDSDDQGTGGSKGEGRGHSN